MTYQWRDMGHITAADAEAEPEASRLFPPEKAVAHYLALIAGDGVTMLDLMVFGAELRKVLRAKQARTQASADS